MAIVLAGFAVSSVVAVLIFGALAVSLTSPAPYPDRVRIVLSK
jgi:hypothetical protein